MANWTLYSRYSPILKRKNPRNLQLIFNFLRIYMIEFMNQKF